MAKMFVIGVLKDVRILLLLCQKIFEISLVKIFRNISQNENKHLKEVLSSSTKIILLG